MNERKEKAREKSRSKSPISGNNYLNNSKKQFAGAHFKAKSTIRMDSSSDEETENSKRNSYSSKETYISKQRGISTRRAAEIEFRSLSRHD